MDSTLSTLSVLLALLVAITPRVGSRGLGASVSPYDGTTKNLREILLGRCYDYVNCELPHKSDCEAYRNNVNCSATVDKFIAAFAYQSPCNLTDSAYDEFLEDAQIFTKENTTLFWSGTLTIALNLATVTNFYTSVERTLPGYMANGLQWCGQRQPPGINFKNCRKCPAGYTGATYTFWKSVSRHFAAQARGEVSVILNSTRKGGAFPNNSTFATQELPNIDPQKVSLVHIQMATDVNLPEGTQREKCSGESITVLRGMIEKKGITNTCSEYNQEIFLIQCVQYPDAAACQNLPSLVSISPQFLSTSTATSEHTITMTGSSSLIVSLISVVWCLLDMI